MDGESANCRSLGEKLCRYKVLVLALKPDSHDKRRSTRREEDLMFRPRYLLPWMQTMTSNAVAMGEIAALSPMVMAMRAERMADPTAGFGGFENFRMVSEKLSALQESAMAAGTAAGNVMGAAVMTGRPPFDAPLLIAEAAMKPVHDRVKANVKRLSKKSPKR